MLGSCLVSPDRNSFVQVDRDGATIFRSGSRPPGQAWARSGCFEDLPDQLDRCGVVWSPDSRVLYVATPEPPRLHKLDADRLAVAKRVQLPGEAVHSVSTMTVSPGGEFLVLLGLDEERLVFRSDTLLLEARLRRPLDCFAVGRGLRALFCFKLPGDGRPPLGWAAVVGIHEGSSAEVCRFGEGMSLRRHEMAPVQRLDWYSLCSRRWTEVTLDTASADEFSFDGRWLVTRAKEGNFLYLIDTAALAACGRRRLSQKRFDRAVSKVSFCGEVATFDAVPQRRRGREASDRPRLLLWNVRTVSSNVDPQRGSKLQDSWVACVQGDELVPEILVSALTHPSASSARGGTDTAAHLRLHGLEGLRVHDDLTRAPQSNYFPRNIRVVTRWLQQIDEQLEHQERLLERPGAAAVSCDVASHVSWLSFLAARAPDALDLILERTSVNDRGILALAYPRLSMVALGPKSSRHALVTAWSRRGTSKMPQLRVGADWPETMEEAALALFMTLSAFGDRRALSIAVEAYREGVHGGSSDLYLDAEGCTVADALAARLGRLDSLRERRGLPSRKN
jgi:hypothetical protein